MHVSQAQIKCDTFPAVFLCTYSVLDKFEIRTNNGVDLR